MISNAEIYIFLLNIIQSGNRYKCIAHNQAPYYIYQQISNQIMNRNTFMAGKQSRNNSQFSAQIDRTTFNPIHNSLTKPSMSKQAQTEKMNQMVNKIMRQVARLYNQTTMRAITKQMLKEGGSKVFYDVFAILARSLDEKIELHEVANIEFVTDVLKLFGYPGNLNRTIFQPIGAPHTWYHCLSILDFMAQIAVFATTFKNYSKQYHKNREIQKDQKFITIKAVRSNDPNILINRLQEQQKQLQNSCNQLKNRTATSELAIENLHLQQGSLSEIDQRIHKQTVRLNKYEQQVIKQQCQKRRFIDANSSLSNKIAEQQIIQNLLKGQVNSLQYKLNHNQVSPQQSLRLQHQITQGQSQIISLEQKYKGQLQQFHCNLQNILNQIGQSIVKHEISSKQIMKHSTTNRFSPVQQYSQQIISKLSTFVQTVLFSKQIKAWNIPIEVNRIFNILPWQSYLRISQKAIQQSRKKVASLRTKHINLNKKLQNLNNNIMNTKTIIQQLKRQKYNIRKDNNSKERQVKQLKEQIKRIKFLTSDIAIQRLKLKERAEKLQRQQTQMMNNILMIKEQSLKLQSKMQHQLTLLKEKIQTCKQKTISNLKNNKQKVKQLLKNFINDMQPKQNKQKTLKSN